MKENKTINKVIIAILLIVLVAGIVTVKTKNFNVGLEYAPVKEIDLQIDQTFDTKEMEQLIKDAIGNSEFRIRRIEVYEDAVAITAKEITDEQKSSIINKVNEKYGTEIKPEDVTTITIGNVRLREIAQKYILPIAISTVIALVYLLIRYFRLGCIKVLLKTIAVLVVAQLELFSIVAIARFPVGVIVLAVALVIYMLSLLGVTSMFENQLQEERKKEENDSDK